MQIVVTGLVDGVAIALLALAFQVVYLPTRVFFVGLAGIYSAAPFLAYAVLRIGGGWMAAVSVSVAGAVALCLVDEWAVHAPLSRRQAASGSHFVASLGTYIVIVQVVTMIWGNDTKSLLSGEDSITNFGQVVVTGAQWLTLGAAVLLLSGFRLFLMRSDVGLRLRALADNPTQFALFGYNVDRHRLLAFGIAGIFACVSSLVTAYSIGFDSHSGLHAVVLAMVAVIFGGQGSLAGPVLGGVLLGLARAQVVWHWSARWQEAVTFGLLAVVLLFLPQGLLGGKARLEASP